MFAWMLQRARALGNKFFLNFGLHCATHQIRIILISGIVITSLFYPALDLYAASPTPIFNPFPSFHAHRDLLELWSAHETLVAREDPVSRARCGTGATVRVERVLVQSPLSEDDDGALNQRILMTTLGFETRLQNYLSTQNIPCLKRTDGRCLVLSPLAFWDHDQSKLLSDNTILDTLSLTRNVSLDGIPVTPQMVLAGRGSLEPHVGGNTFDFATFLALTYFLKESDCFGNSDHIAWVKAVQSTAGQDAELISHSEEPTLIALEYDATRSRKKGWSAISALPYVAYISFIVYVFWSMRQLTSVHSRVGLAFTALVEIIVSTITSLSVCALVKFKVTLVPWELLPIVIVFVGAENMFNLADAIGKTPVTLSVKQRVAEGLSRAGTSNTLKVVSYNAILGVIAVFSSGAIRQFCIFAIVVLVAHWFLAHTFFIAVLSIDLQRLELDELLRQDAGLSPSLKRTVSETVPIKSGSAIWKFGVLIRKILSGRAKKNLSLVLLLAITATLYYATMPPEHNSGADNNLSSLPRGALSRYGASQTTNSSHFPDRQIWKMLNPNDGPLHLRVESPSILTFGPDVNQSGNAQSKRKSRCRPTIWWFKIIILPIAATTFVLWGILLYLLKDAERLDAQKHRAEAEPDLDSKEQPPTLEQKLSFSTLPRAFSSDVELIATSNDGRVVISIGLHNEVAIWRAGSVEQFSIDASNVLQASTSLATLTLTAVSVDQKGDYCAVGTSSGVIAVYNIQKKNAVRSYSHLKLPDFSAGVVDLHLFSSPTSSSFPPPLHLIAMYENNAVVRYTLDGSTAPVNLCPVSTSTHVLYSKLLPSVSDGGVLVAFCLDNGVVELVESGNGGLPLIKDNFSIQAGHPMDAVNNLHLCHTAIGGETRVVIATATEKGVVCLWDGQNGECIQMLDDVFGRVNQLRVFPLRPETCRFCGNLPPEGVCLSFSVNHVVRFCKVYRHDDTRRCSCTMTSSPAKKMQNSFGKTSRRNSVTSVGTSSPLRPRSRGPSTSDVSPFPVSGHGIHSRRTSEKADASRRASEGAISPLESEERELRNPFGLPEPNGKAGPSFWQRTHAVCTADTDCERGGWDIHEGKVVGVRRRPRLVTQTNGSIVIGPSVSLEGLSRAVLSRWEIWTFDPCSYELQSSVISALATDVDQEVSSSNHTTSTSSSPSPIPRLPFTRVSPFIVTRSTCIAGFGNTLGVFRFVSQ
ncbi:hypothetical protein E1B28_002474 [Marasmius oreades]|uniref:Sterol regulatory element-binding protein cleavage-activating protein n=1 Tax=Marasmius oreades TaxID=181124 RepID=A0A9P7UKQ6_9AGAR|nr:uncharacterized protein E1B28_002474 [Marasmius oreades]KAG7086522.1 hypothetical protein E1B28_002474 [Marasmius oreades]